MSAKPTPGPYEIRKKTGGCDVRGRNGVVLGWFCRAAIVGKSGVYLIDTPEAEANARAWVEGIAAMEKLKEIRRAIDRGPDADVALCSIVQILDEAKP